jgi:alpha-tubulin suppressor-like RCC1 family protein
MFQAMTGVKKLLAAVLVVTSVLSAGAAQAQPGQAWESNRNAVLSAGYDHTLLVHASGSLWAWGGNFGGQLGDGTNTNRATPAPVAGLTDVVATASGSWGFSFALRKDGTVWAWGMNYRGVLGTGEYGPPRFAPVKVKGLTDVVAIKAGANHALALRADGTVWAWGSNQNGQLGDGSPWWTMPYALPEPTQVPGLTDVVDIAAGEWHSLALRADGTLWTWGDNSSNQLGDPGRYFQSNTPAQVLTDVKAMAGGEWHSLALRTDGTVWGWGLNLQNQVSGAYFPMVQTPVLVEGLTDVVALAAGQAHSLAIREDGTLWGWGDNSSNQVGFLDNSNQPTPRPVLEGVVAVTADQAHTLALRKDGTLWAWGLNGSGNLLPTRIGAPIEVSEVPLPCRFTAVPSAEHRAAQSQGCHATP